MPPVTSIPLQQAADSCPTQEDLFYSSGENGSHVSSDATGSSGFSSETVVPERPRMRPDRMWPFDEVFSTRRAVHVENIPDYVVEGFEVRGWGEPAREAVVIPIVADNAELPSALLILGLNSRRPFDKDYSDWIDLTRLSLNSLLTAVKGREADISRAE